MLPEPDGTGRRRAILKLRALISNGDFDDYWDYQLRQEQHRVRHTRYRDSCALAA